MEFLDVQLKDSVGTLTLNNMAKRNALSGKLIEEALEALHDLAAEKARTLVLRAPSGAKVWSAGHDVRELPSGGRDPLAYMDSLEQLIRAIRCFPAPVIAMVEGSVWGGACEVVVTCDILIASHSATFAATPAKLGVPYNTTGLLNFMNILGARIVKEMFFTGKPISAQRAFDLGVVNHLVGQHELEDFTYKMAREIAENSPLSIQVMKEQLRILENASPLSPETFERLQGLRRMVYDSEDYQEGIHAFMEKRKPVFKGK